MYDNPPAGPMGVHRGARSAASRAMPYVIVIIVALLAGLLFWSIYSGEINNLKMPWSSQESSTTSSAEKSKSGESKSKSQSDSASGNKTDASNADSPTDSQQNDQNADQNAGQNAEQTDNATAQQAVNTGTEVRVVNATKYHRLCAKQGRRADPSRVYQCFCQQSDGKRSFADRGLVSERDR